MNLKKGSKVSVLRKSENSENWQEVGKGIVKSFRYNFADVPAFAEILFKENMDANVTELIALNSKYIKVVELLN